MTFSPMVNALAKLPEAEVLPPDLNPAGVYLASLSEVGRRGVISRLRKVARLVGHSDPLAVPWQLMRYPHVEAIRSRLIEDGEAPATVNLAISALRGIAKAAFNLELISADELQRLQSVKPARGDRLPRGRAITPGELEALMRACGEDDGPAGIRDAALIGLLYAAGLRRAEIVALDASHYGYVLAQSCWLGFFGTGGGCWGIAFIPSTKAIRGHATAAMEP